MVEDAYFDSLLLNRGHREPPPRTRSTAHEQLTPFPWPLPTPATPQLDIFDSEGRLTDVWMFRDATDPERHLLMSRRQQLAQMMQQQGQGHKGQRKGQKGQQTATKA